MIGLLAIGWALAQEPEPSPPEAEPDADDVLVVDSEDSDTAYEVVVYGEHRVQEARREIDHTLRQAGFTIVKERNGRTIYRHENPTGGEVVVHEEEGFMRVKRQPVRVEGVEMPWAERNSPLAWAGCVIWLPACVRPGGQLQSRRRHMSAETEAAQRVQDEVSTWAERIADLAVDRKTAALPERLEALWDDGAPLEGDGVLPDAEARRRALFDFWATRTDTVWGEEVRQAVEAFLRAVVQPSDHPFTEGELAALNADSPAGRPLELPTP